LKWRGRVGGGMCEREESGRERRRRRGEGDEIARERWFLRVQQVKKAELSNY
jgi:hypothetical protein